MKRYIYLILRKIFVFLIPTKSENNFQIKHIGSFYGGYDIVVKDKIAHVISCGLGEDATFDIESINKFNCKVIAVDPTPRAKNHYEQICSKSCVPKTLDYFENSGKQKIDSYDLKKINKDNFILIYKAITDKNNSKIKLYFPKNKNFVSSSVEIDKNYSKDFFVAETINIKTILQNHKIEHIDILKLDIEGGEFKVLNDIIKNKIYPDQLLVEFKNIKSVNFFKLFKIFWINKKLLKKGYQIVFINKKGDYTYLKIN